VPRKVVHVTDARAWWDRSDLGPESEGTTPAKSTLPSLRDIIRALERTFGYSETPREGLNGIYSETPREGLNGRTIRTWVLPRAPGPPTVNT
jgi:hypothetical protein